MVYIYICNIWDTIHFWKLKVSGSYRPAPKDAKEGMDVATGEEAAPVEAPVEALEALDSVPGIQDIDLQDSFSEMFWRDVWSI